MEHVPPLPQEFIDQHIQEKRQAVGCTCSPGHSIQFQDIGIGVVALLALHHEDGCQSLLRENAHLN